MTALPAAISCIGRNRYGGALDLLDTQKRLLIEALQNRYRLLKTPTDAEIAQQVHRI
jgi:hypothetical protein